MIIEYKLECEEGTVLKEEKRNVRTWFGLGVFVAGLVKEVYKTSTPPNPAEFSDGLYEGLAAWTGKKGAKKFFELRKKRPKD